MIFENKGMINSCHWDANSLCLGVIKMGSTKLIGMLRMSTRGLCILGAFFLLILVGFCDPTFAQQAEEYALKASYIERFVQFVEWPTDMPADTTEPFEIGIIGQDPFEGGLEEVFGNVQVSDQKVRIRRVALVDEIQSCDLLFISKSEKESLQSILKVTSNMAILTVGDSEGYAKAGVIINFFVDDDRLHFKINIKAARNSGLEIDPFLLDYAQIEDSPEGAPK